MQLISSYGTKRPVCYSSCRTSSRQQTIFFPRCSSSQCTRGQFLLQILNSWDSDQFSTGWAVSKNLGRIDRTQKEASMVVGFKSWYRLSQQTFWKSYPLGYLGTLMDWKLWQEIKAERSWARISVPAKVFNVFLTFYFTNSFSFHYKNNSSNTFTITDVCQNWHYFLTTHGLISFKHAKQLEPERKLTC